jgi:hypothetical protein
MSTHTDTAAWFTDCITVESIKTRYRQLARQHHPDLGGDTATMQDVNAAYHAALAACDGQESHDEAGRAHSYHYRREREQEIMDKIADLLRVLPVGVELALIGLWVWIIGTTREDTTTRAALKTAGCRWHVRRGCWYWRPAEMRHYGRQARGSLTDLAMRYGCRTFENRDDMIAATA